MSLIWSETATSKILGDISINDTIIPIQKNDYKRFLISETSGEDMCATIRSANNYEYIKIDVASSTTGGLSATRGQGGSSARAWKSGSLVYASLPSEAYESFTQQAYRTYAGDPTANITPDYVGEKLYDSTNHVWYKSKSVLTSSWVLIAGTPITCSWTDIWFTDVVSDPYDWDFSYPGLQNYGTLEGGGEGPPLYAASQFADGAHRIAISVGSTGAWMDNQTNDSDHWNYIKFDLKDSNGDPLSNIDRLRVYFIAWENMEEWDLSLRTDVQPYTDADNIAWVDPISSAPGFYSDVYIHASHSSAFRVVGAELCANKEMPGGGGE